MENCFIKKIFNIILFHKNNYFCIRKIQIHFTQKKIGYAIINDTIIGEAVKRAKFWGEIIIGNYIKNNKLRDIRFILVSHIHP